MAIRDGFAAILSSVGSMASRAAGAIRGGTVAPPANLIASGWGASTGNQSEKIARLLNTPEAYFGRLSYDAGPSLTRFSSDPATDLTPQKIVSAQKQATSGWPLQLMEMNEQVLSRDAHLSGIGQQRVDDVVKGSWRLVRSTPDDVAACTRGFCEESIRSADTLDDGLAWLLWGNAYSYSAAEMTWWRQLISFPGPKGERIGPISAVVPRRFDSVHPKHFRFDLRTDEPYLWFGSDMVSMPYGKFIFYRGEGQHPITERRGYMWQCLWLSMFKSIGWSGWATYVERYGLPTPLIQYDGDVAQYRENKQAYEDILRMLGQGLGGVVPSQNFKLDFPQPAQGGRANDPHSALSDACDAAQSIRVLGATLTAKIGNVGSFAASSTHADVKYAREEADARRLWASLRQDLLGPLVLFNAEALAAAFTAAGYPCTPDEVLRRVPRGLHRVPREIDPLQRGELVSMAINEWGLEVGKEALYDEMNLPQPMSKNDVAPGEPQLVSSGGKAVGAVEASNEGAEAPQPANAGGSEPDAKQTYMTFEAQQAGKKRRKERRRKE